MGFTAKIDQYGQRSKKSQGGTMSLLPALKKDKTLVEEMDHWLEDEERFHLWWLGQSGYLIEWKGQRVLIDPYLSDSLTKKYAHTSKPHIRMSERVIDPELLRNITVVSSSHNHTDHLDAETLIPVLRNNPGIHFVVPEANRSFVADRVQCDKNFLSGLNVGLSLTIGHFTFHGIAAKHNEIEKDENGCCRYMGYVIEFGKWKIYHSGDTLWYDELVTVLKPYAVDLALLPINGNDPKREVAGNLNAREAAELGRQIKAKWVIPCHYDMFTFNTVDVTEFEKEARLLKQPYKILKGGERFAM
jgi:L-ascorbate metabolism protein UlaG (beta-lactamase superfamily)